MDAKVRGFWARSQGLDGALAGATAHEVLVRCGWMRTVGGAGPYLGLFARSGLDRAAVDRAIAEDEICELPSARGCTYLIPRADYPLALAAGRSHNDAGEIALAKKHLGVTEAELDRLSGAILDALDRGPLDPRALKDAVGDAVRHLGDAGKKRGITTTLSLGLGRLQSAGRIKRIPASGRLDQQRYSYARWEPAPAADLGEDEVAIELARRFFRWIGPATLDQLCWWGGLSKKSGRTAVAAVGAVPSGDGPDLVLPEQKEALADLVVPREPRISLVGSLDNLFHLRRQVGPLVDEADRDLVAAGGGFSTARPGVVPVSTVLDLPHHAIVDRGRLIGLWDYDPEEGEVVARVFQGAPDPSEAVAATTRFVRDQLGDARAFSLDSPESRADRLAALRAS